MNTDDNDNDNDDATTYVQDGQKKRSWTKDEDERLLCMVGIYGAQRWAYISEMMPGRTGKQCHNRWRNSLNPEIRKGSWTEKEDNLLLSLVKERGTQWSQVREIKKQMSLVNAHS